MSRTAAARRYFEPRLETMDPGTLRELQWEAMRAQLARAAESPFYRRRFAQTGVDVRSLRTPADLVQVPVTTKDDICSDVEEHPPYGTRLRVAPEQVVDIVETSGTSGLGKEVHVLSRADRDRIYRIEAFGFVWAGVEAGDVVALTLPVAMTAAGNWWLMTLERLDAACLRLGSMEVEAKLDYLLRYQPQVLVATPAYVTRMERAAVERGIDLPSAVPRLRSILLSGEAKGVEWAAAREQAWGARVYEQWGCCAGAVTWNCEGGMLDGTPDLRLMHSQPHLTYLEVVDRANGRQVADGEYGEVVITPLGTEASPLIRFATGDRARYLEAHNCTCGRPFPGLQAGSVSRYDDMVRVKGVNVWPSAVANLLDRYAEVTEHRVTVYADENGREQIKLDALVAAGVPRDNAAALAEELRRGLRSQVGVSFDVELHDEAGSGLAGEVLQAGSGKVRRWRDLRNPER